MPHSAEPDNLKRPTIIGRILATAAELAGPDGTLLVADLVKRLSADGASEREVHGCLQMIAGRRLAVPREGQSTSTEPAPMEMLGRPWRVTRVLPPSKSTSCSSSAPPG